MEHTSYIETNAGVRYRNEREDETGTMRKRRREQEVSAEKGNAVKRKAEIGNYVEQQRLATLAGSRK